jgi:hypothetical protein
MNNYNEGPMIRAPRPAQPIRSAASKLNNLIHGAIYLYVVAGTFMGYQMYEGNFGRANVTLVKTVGSDNGISLTELRRVCPSAGFVSKASLESKSEPKSEPKSESSSAVPMPDEEAVDARSPKERKRDSARNSIRSALTEE